MEGDEEEIWYNVVMKMQIGVGVAMLSALAAEGRFVLVFVTPRLIEP